MSTERWFGDGKAACTGLVDMAATRDNGHVDGKLRNDCHWKQRWSTITVDVGLSV